MKTENPVSSPAAQALSRVFSPMPYDTFHCEEVRSLTVHLEHAGEWRVYTRTEDGPNEVFPDYFPTWEAASKVCDACNAVLRAVPGATPAEVFAFFASRETRGNASRYVLTHCETGLHYVIARGFVAERYSDASQVTEDERARVAFVLGECFNAHLASTLG